MDYFPLVVTLWEHQNFRGRKRTIIKHVSDLGEQTYNDMASSIEIHRGPGYDAWKAVNNGREPMVGFYEDKDFGGAELLLPAGRYANLKYVYSFGDTISSVHFEARPAAARSIAQIPFIVTLFKEMNFKGSRLQIFESTANIAVDFGAEYDNSFLSAIVEEGPNFLPGSKIKLFVNNDFAGAPFELAPGRHTDLSFGLGNGNAFISSIKLD